MKTSKKILIMLLPVLAAAGLIILLSGKKKKLTVYRQSKQIAEEGYETAGDILFPHKNQSARYRPEWN